MLVKLQNNWFAPGERRFRKGKDGEPVQIPDNLRKFLPKTAIVVSDAPAKEPVKAEEKVETLADHDEERKAQDEAIRKLEEADRAEADARKKTRRKG